MTYSIAARDPRTGELGAAVQSHWFAAGELVPWAEAGVGAVATQALVGVGYGPLGLDLMRGGKRAPQALRALLAADEGEMHRQVAMVDPAGEVAAHTGSRCLREAGHRTGDGYSVQANMMLRDTVWDAMAEAFEKSTGPLTYRLLAALDAAEAEGGDVRGRQAAGILVVKDAPSGRPWEDVVVHLRVDDHPAPLEELRRLVTSSSPTTGWTSRRSSSSRETRMAPCGNSGPPWPRTPRTPRSRSGRPSRSPPPVRSMRPVARSPSPSRRTPGGSSSYGAWRKMGSSRSPWRPWQPCCPPVGGSRPGLPSSTPRLRPGETPVDNPRRRGRSSHRGGRVRG